MLAGDGCPTRRPMDHWYQPDLVLPGLFLSSCEAEQDLQTLRKNDITHILQVGSELSPSHPDSFTYLKIDVLDKPFVDIVSHLAEAVQFIDQAISAGSAVLVHCRAGVSRSATIVIAYQMWKQKEGLKASIEATRKARWGVLPNPGFLCQLLEYEQLQYDLSKWQGWGLVRWLEHPLAATANQLHEEFSPTYRGLPLEAVMANSGVNMEGVDTTAGGQEYVPLALPASTLQSPFAQLLLAAAAAGDAQAADTAEAQSQL
eukprot:GHUV01010356.1.p1 GENE.GHUV01010356.1~~GHUV01010356.1.p1  ORF type:complete len:259 (+),score=71.90 GHUV01010356.1:1009-1785(+)